MTIYTTPERLEFGAIYEIKSRNLLAGAYNGRRGFIGIRTKFGDRYLFTEQLAGKDGGTVYPIRPLQPIGHVPDGIELVETLGVECEYCRKPAEYMGLATQRPWTCGGGCERTMPRAVANVDLFKVLEDVEERL